MKTQAQLWMTGLLGSCLLGLCLAGCPASDDGQVADPLPDWPGPPVLRPQSLELAYGEEVPGAGEALKPELSGQLGVREQALVGDPAVLLPPMRRGLEISNNILWPVLARMRNIYENEEPVLYSEDLVIWQVTRDRLYFQFVLSRSPDDPAQWDYVLQGRSADERDQELSPVLSGFFRPGAEYTDDLQVGAGLLRFHRRTGLRNSAQPSLGSIAFRIQPDGRRQLNILVENNDGLYNTLYHYSLGPNGFGLMSLLTQYDLLPGAEHPGEELLSQVVLWRPDRAARARLKLRYRERGAAQLSEASLDECWGSNLRQIWVQWDPGELGESDGDESECAAEFRQQPPSLPNEEMPEGDPDIPEAE